MPPHPHDYDARHGHDFEAERLSATPDDWPPTPPREFPDAEVQRHRDVLAEALVGWRVGRPLRQKAP